MVNNPLSRLFWYHAQLVFGLVDNIYRAAISPFGLTVIEWHVVHELYARDGQQPTDLARLVGRSTTSFTPILDGLERKAWINRRHLPIDRRAVFIHLTDHARQQQAGMETSLVTLETQLREQLSQVELDSVQAIQTKLETLTAV